ncbi:MAG: hypothetical protein EA396_11975 [Anaerolineaceae bacterium]|nr:MAG: hypothetical protein EA396_11975 [Anaerolineaceae bacterium]
MRWLLLVMIAALTACSGVLFDDPPTPTWEMTGPTLAPTVAPIQSFPTNPADNILSAPGQNDPTAAALPPGSSLPPVIVGDVGSGVRSVRVTLSGGRHAIGYLYENPPLEIEGRIVPARYPGVLLLGATREEWGRLPAGLVQSGNSVLIVEPDEPLFIEDFEDVFISLQETGSVDPGAMAVIGAESSAELALVGCSALIGCDALVMLSPPVMNAAMRAALETYNPRPSLIVASNDDPTTYQSAGELLAVAGDHADAALLLNAGRGASMLAAADGLDSQIIDWLRDVLIEELTPLPLDDPFFDFDPSQLIDPDIDAPIGGFDLDLDLDLGLDDDD